MLPPQNDASVGAMTSGSVERISVTEGVGVAKGDLLATIISPAIVQLQQDFITTGVSLDLLKKEYDRQKLLNEEKITAEKKFQETEADLKNTEARYESLKVQLELMNLRWEEVRQGKISRSAKILSPISGYIEEVMIKAGQYVSPEQPMFRIINRERLYIELMVFEKDIPFIRIGQRVTFELANLGGEEYEAALISIGHMVEENARTVKTIAELNNKSGIILPGMFVSAEIHTDEQNLDALPEEAVVIEDENNAYIFYTVSPAGLKETEFKKAPVKTGFREEGYLQVELLTAIPADARIVTKGAYFIRAEGLKD
jgi:cobalt-zinc-cadmium efflux system membrane fusion protein